MRLYVAVASLLPAHASATAYRPRHGSVAYVGFDADDSHDAEGGAVVSYAWRVASDAVGLAIPSQVAASSLSMLAVDSSAPLGHQSRN